MGGFESKWPGDTRELPESWERALDAGARNLREAIDEEIIRSFEPREKIVCEHEETKWRYVDPPRRPVRYDGRADGYREDYSYHVHSFMAIILHTTGEIHWTSSNGIYIVSIRTGTQWKEDERRLHVCRMDQGMMAPGNIGIVVNEESYNVIMEAIREYNRGAESPIITRWPNHITLEAYENLSRADKEAVRERYYQDFATLTFIRKDIQTPRRTVEEHLYEHFKSKKLPDNKQLSDDMFKVD